MKSSSRGRLAAAADDVGGGRRFPDPPPPHGRGTDSASVDMSALVFRREQLLQELHRERIRHDMIMCELAEIERVMTVCLAGRGAWCGRPLMTPWEEAMYRTSRSSEETSWRRRSPSRPEIAPVYPRVERSPSPVRQLRSVDNAVKQEPGSSSRPLTVAPSAFPDVEQCRSLSKQPAVEEALVPAATNIVAKPAQLALLSKEVTLESRGAVDHAHGAGLKDRHVVQPMQSGIQIGGQVNHAAIDQEHEAEAKDTHAVLLMECQIQRSEQPTHVAAGQECRAEAKDSHAVQLMECEIKRSEQLKRVAIGGERKVDMNVGHAMQMMESKLPRSEQVKHGAIDQEHEAEVNNHEVQLKESEIHRTEQPKREAIYQEHEEEKDRHAVQLSKISEQSNPAEPTIKDHTDDEWWQLPHALAGKEKSPPNEQKRLVFNEPNTQITPSGVKGGHILRPVVETPPRKRHKPSEEWSCTCCQVSLSCEEDLTQHQAGDLHRLNLATFQPRQETAEITADSTPEHSFRAPRFPRRFVRPTLTNNLETSEPQTDKRAFGFDPQNLTNNLEKSEPQTAKRAFGFDLHNHFKGRSHQENTQALHTEGSGKEGSKRVADRMGTEDPRKKFVTKRRFLFCELCKVQCNSEMMMQSHLGGKKHRENLQSRP